MVRVDGGEREEGGSWWDMSVCLAARSMHAPGWRKLAAGGNGRDLAPKGRQRRPLGRSGVSHASVGSAEAPVARLEPSPLPRPAARFRHPGARGAVEPRRAAEVPHGKAKLLHRPEPPTVRGRHCSQHGRCRPVPALASRRRCDRAGRGNGGQRNAQHQRRRVRGWSL